MVFCEFSKFRHWVFEYCASLRLCREEFKDNGLPLKLFIFDRNRGCRKSHSIVCVSCQCIGLYIFRDEDAETSAGLVQKVKATVYVLVVLVSLTRVAWWVPGGFLGFGFLVVWSWGFGLGFTLTLLEHRPNEG